MNAGQEEAMDKQQITNNNNNDKEISMEPGDDTYEKMLNHNTSSKDSEGELTGEEEDDGYVKMGDQHGASEDDFYSTVKHNEQQSDYVSTVEIDEDSLLTPPDRHMAAYNITMDAIQRSVILNELTKEEANHFLLIVWLALKNKATPSSSPERTFLIKREKAKVMPPLPPRGHRQSLPANFAPNFAAFNLSNTECESEEVFHRPIRKRSFQVGRRGRLMSDGQIPQITECETTAEDGFPGGSDHQKEKQGVQETKQPLLQNGSGPTPSSSSSEKIPTENQVIEESSSSLYFSCASSSPKNENRS